MCVIPIDRYIQAFQRFLEDSCSDRIEQIMNEIEDSISYALEVKLRSFDLADLSSAPHPEPEFYAVSDVVLQSHNLEGT